jgi:hypothetical protein
MSDERITSQPAVTRIPATASEHPFTWFRIGIVAACLLVIVPFVFRSYSKSDSNPTVYVTRTGSHYHRFGCQYLAKSSIPISLEDAINRGELPCSRCKPPILGQRPKPK